MKILRPITNKVPTILYSIVKWYYRKPRRITRRTIPIVLRPTVFHPGLYKSTDMLLDYVLELPVDSKSVLELGAGSGFISLYLAKNRDCHVLASDINPNAINGLEESALLNQVNLQLVQCDLFDKIPRIQFDYILINPPYFDKTISSIDEYAFYAGEDLDYFSRLFDQIKQYISPKTKVIVILSETAPLKNLFNMAQSAGLFFQQVHQQKKRNETFFIFELDFIHREQHDDHSIAS